VVVKNNAETWQREIRVLGGSSVSLMARFGKK
jgi:hypothetical protein